MSAWGATTSNESKPKWLTDAQKENTFATQSGWVYRNPDTGLEEVIVAIRNLEGSGSSTTKLGYASVSKVSFSTGTYTAGTTKSIKVEFNEKVNVTGNPTLVVTGSVAGAVTATYASQNAAKTVLTFEFTVPAAGDTLSVGAQSITLAGGTIVETSGSEAAVLTITAGQGTAAGTKTTV
jgi:hypothetical protein